MVQMSNNLLCQRDRRRVGCQQLQAQIARKGDTRRHTEPCRCTETPARRQCADVAGNIERRQLRHSQRRHGKTKGRSNASVECPQLVSRSPARGARLRMQRATVKRL